MQDAESKKINKALGAFVAIIMVISAIVALLTFPRTANAYFLTSEKSNATTVSSGATLPYVEMEAHSATTNGTVIGPDYQLGDLASDAVDRTIVQLTKGQYV